MIAAYILSVIVLALLLAKEYRAGVEMGYPFTMKERIFAMFLILCPVLNTLFALYLLLENLYN